MEINKKIKEELLRAIQDRTSESFETETSGGMKHFISSDGTTRGMYIGSINDGDKEFKIYMI